LQTKVRIEVILLPSAALK